MSLQYKRSMRVLWSFLTASERRRLLTMGTLMLSLAALELLGVGSLFPYMKVLGDHSVIHTNTYAASVYAKLGFASDYQFLVFFGIVIVSMILLKGVLSILSIILQAKFASHFRNHLSEACLRSFLDAPFSLSLQRNSAVCTKNLITDVSNVTSVITQSLILATDVLVSASLVSLMIYIDPMLIISVFALMAVTMAAITYFTKAKILAISRENEVLNRAVYQHAAESLQGIKELKVYRAEQYFIRRFMQPLEQFNENTIVFNAVTGVPGILVNTLAFALLVGVMLFLLVIHGDLLHILPILSVIAVSVQRLLPAAIRIYNAIGLIRRYDSSLYVIRNLLDEQQQHMPVRPVEKLTLNFERQLELRNVCFTYPNTSEPVLNGVNLKIQKNSSLGIVGPSGAGKSTLVNIMLGLLSATQGQVVCDDVEITASNRHALTNLVGYVPQKIFLLDDTLLANIAFGVAEQDIDHGRVIEAIRAAQLTTLVDELAQGLQTKIGEHGARLSGGQCQRVGIARALYKNPEILIMDEATNALDSVTEREFNQALKVLTQLKTMIIIAHRPSSIRFCDRLLYIDKGRGIALGTYQELYETHSTFRALYGAAEVDW